MQPETLDQDAVNLAKSIRQVESGGNFKARGKSGEYGGYQFMPSTWNSTARKYGVNAPLEQSTPEQQNEVAYRQIKEWKDQGLNPGAIASMWNSGKPDAYLDPKFKGINQHGAEFDVPGYAKKVAETYHSIKGQPVAPQNNSVPGQENNLISPAYASENEQGTKPKSTAGKVLSAVGKGVDFFLPILGDIKNIAEGDNTKSKKQLLGDAALSALTLVPGAGLATKGLTTAAKIGLRAAEGYGVGVAQNLAEGKGFKESIKPGLGTLGGAGLGVAVPGLISAGSKAVKNIAGITPQIENALKGMAGRKGEAKFERFINTAKERNGDIKKPSAQNLAADDIELAARKIKSSIMNEGVKVGAAKKQFGDQRIVIDAPEGKPSLNGVLKKFMEETENRFGLSVYTDKSGKKVFLKNAPGRVKNVLSSPERNGLKKAFKELMDLGKGGNLTKASDVLDNLDAIVPHVNSKVAPLKKSQTKLESFLGTTRHNLNEVIGASSPELAKAKTRFHELSNMQRELGQLAGEQTQRGELLMRRVFSGDFGADVIKTFEKIGKETGVDLVDSAVLAKFATDTVGSSADKTLLQQILNTKTGSGLYQDLKGLGIQGLQKLIADPERIGRGLVRGKGPRLLPQILQQSATSQAARVPGLLAP